MNRKIYFSFLCLSIAHTNSLKDNIGEIKRENPDDVLNSRAASNGLPEKNNVVSDSSNNYPYFFEIKDVNEQIRARLNLTKGPLTLELVKTTKNDKNVITLVKEDKNPRKVKIFGTSFLNKTTPKTSAEVNGDGTDINIKISYNDMPSDDDTYKVTNATLQFNVHIGGPTKRDYWNITSAKIVVDSNINGTNMSLTVDLTPKFSYTSYSADSACTTGYGICAPMRLCWSCNDQVMKTSNLTKVGSDKWTLLLHLPGMVFQPNSNSTSGDDGKFRFSDNWDCDPIFPISLWVGILITLMLATILYWALYMLSALQTPNKFDDPKGPSIHVTQNE